MLWQKDQRTAYYYGHIGLTLTLMYDGSEFGCSSHIIAESLDVDDVRKVGIGGG